MSPSAVRAWRRARSNPSPPVFAAEERRLSCMPQPTTAMPYGFYQTLDFTRRRYTTFPRVRVPAPELSARSVRASNHMAEPGRAQQAPPD
jgi:hypothetical protein